MPTLSTINLTVDRYKEYIQAVSHADESWGKVRRRGAETHAFVEEPSI